MDGVLPCVYCRKRPVVPEWRPFCSERCKMADLGRWLAEDYRVPEAAPEDGVPPSPPSQDGGALDES
jgi:endogenous inhibitor of DNA gyrase (YacG/DUF329 family)